MSATAPRIAALLALLVACEKATPPEPPPPPPAPQRPLTIRYAGTTELSTAGTNDNYYVINENQSLFIVSDAEVASPADPAKSVAEGVAQRFDKGCVATTGSVAPSEEVQLQCALREAAAWLDRTSTVSLAVAVARDRRVLAATFGDVSIVSVRAGRANVIRNQPQAPLGAAARLRTFSLDIEANDTLALVNKDLVAAIGVAGIERRAAGPFENPTAVEAAVASIIADAKQAPDHGPFTVLLLHFVEK